MVETSDEPLFMDKNTVQINRRVLKEYFGKPEIMALVECRLLINLNVYSAHVFIPSTEWHEAPLFQEETWQRLIGQAVMDLLKGEWEDVAAYKQGHTEQALGPPIEAGHDTAGSGQEDGDVTVRRF